MAYRENLVYRLIQYFCNRMKMGRVYFWVLLPVEWITGELNFKIELLNEIANCFIVKDGNCRKEYVSHIEEFWFHVR